MQRLNPRRTVKVKASFAFLSKLFTGMGAVKFNIDGKPAPKDMRLVGIEPMDFHAFENETATLFFESMEFDVVGEGELCREVNMEGARLYEKGHLKLNGKDYEIMGVEWMD